MAARRSVVCLAVAFLALATSARAQDLAGTWRVDSRTWRKLVVNAGQARLDVEWPERGLVSLVGVARGADANLCATESATPGLAGVVEGRRAGRPRPPLTVRVRLTSDDADGAEADATWSEGARVVRQERWTRPGPPTIELLAIEPDVEWQPKTQGPLTVRFRVSGQPVALRLRVVLQASDDSRDEKEMRRFAFYSSRMSARDDGRAARVVIRERELEEFEPGEHEVTWDGRDGSSDARLAMGGLYRIVLLGEGVRAEGRARVAPPRSEYVGPQWPKRLTRDSRGELRVDEGRNRRTARSLSESGHDDLGFQKPPATHVEAVTATETLEALETAAIVTIATHGDVDNIALYAGSGGEWEDRKHVQTIRAEDLDARAEAVGQEKPLADLHMVIISACLTGRGEALVPRGLIARGADVVVCFSEMIIAAGHELFLTNALEGSLKNAKDTNRLMNIGEVMVFAARASDRVVWRERTDDDKRTVAEWRAIGAFKLEEVLRVEVAPGIDREVEQLAPAKWGCSTN